MQRYFVNKEQINKTIVKINEDDSYHITTVMRMELNDKVTVCDNENTYLCKVIKLGKKVELEIIDKLDLHPELIQNITIAHGLVRREKMEEVVRRLVELGCYQYIPVDMKKSVVKNKDINLDRLNKIIKEASEQSERTKLMKISNVISFNSLIKIFNSYDLVLLCHAKERENINLFNEIKNKDFKNILVIIGPESGFDDSEISALTNYNAKIISLGKRVLRTETAPLYIMAVLSFIGEQYEN